MNDNLEWICSKCGYKNTSLGNFCENCGTSISDGNIHGISESRNKAYTKIDHIEYDEEYNSILKSLSNICDYYNGNVINMFSSIESAINSFPDKYSTDSIQSIKDSVKGNINFISSLVDMTNYSILAYQVCDEELKGNLLLLIDSLFGDTNPSFAEIFKNTISNDISKTNGIMEYQEETNLKKLQLYLKILANHHNASIVSGKELKKIIDDNAIKELDSLLVVKNNESINGVNFDTYYVIDEDTCNINDFNKYIDTCNKKLSNIDNNVLKYIRNGGTSILYYSDGTVDAGSYYNGDYLGNIFGGYCNSTNRNVVVVYGSVEEGIIHEVGHAFDFTISYNLTNQTDKTITNPNAIAYAPKLNGRYFYEIAIEELDTMLSPESIGATLDNVINSEPFTTYKYTLPDGSKYEYYGEEIIDDYYIPDFSLYSNSGLINIDGSSHEFFAEAFKKYYSDDADVRNSYDYLMPKTFDYIDMLVEMVGGKDAN